jgi:hypothetical protein
MWDWESYSSELRFSSDRIALARKIVDTLSQEIARRGLPWEAVFRKGYVVFNRAGGYNVLGVDMMWLKPVRLWVKLQSQDESTDLDDPYPNLASVWDSNGRQWGWHVETIEDVRDVSCVVDIGERLNA